MSEPARTISATVSAALAAIQVKLLPKAKARARARRLLAKHHYLGEVRAVGEQLFYALTFRAGQLPPVNAFWSATRYDGNPQLRIENPINWRFIHSPMLPGMK